MRNINRRFAILEQRLAPSNERRRPSMSWLIGDPAGYGLACRMADCAMEHGADDPRTLALALELQQHFDRKNNYRRQVRQKAK